VEKPGEEKRAENEKIRKLHENRSSIRLEMEI